MSKRRPFSLTHHASLSSPSTAVNSVRGGASFLGGRKDNGSNNPKRSLFDRSISNLEKGDGGADIDATPSLVDTATSAAGADDHDDRWNYALLLALYTLQGIPMGLSASIPFLIQQKVKVLAEAAAATASHVAAAAGEAATETASTHATAAAAVHHPSVAKMAYNAQAIFALCSWPFSLKLLWAPVVDAVFFRRFGRRKSWLVPVQALAGFLMVTFASFVEEQLGLGQIATAAGDATATAAAATTFDVRGITLFFFALYFLMATQDIAVDGWALTMLSRKNRGRGPVCNSIGQNVGYFLSFVGFLALNDAESSEKLWRPLLGLESKPGTGIVSLGGFIRFCGGLMLSITTLVAIFKREVPLPKPPPEQRGLLRRIASKEKLDEDHELDASEIGLHETYHRLWAVCKLPAVRWLFLILITYRLPTALSDNVKFLKAVEYGMSKQTTALLSPTLILPLGIIVPIVAAKVWHGNPLAGQFMDAYKVRVTLVALFDVAMLLAVRYLRDNHDISSQMLFWAAVIGSTGLQAIVHSLQFNAQMTFFAHRVDPAIGGSYMTLLNTAANLGGTWPSSFVMLLVGQLTVPPDCVLDEATGKEICTGGRDAYFPLQALLSILGCLWIWTMGPRVRKLAALPDDSWRTHINDDDFVGAEMGSSSMQTKIDPKSE